MLKKNEEIDQTGDLIKYQLSLTEQQISAYNSVQKKLDVLLQEHPWLAPENMEQCFTKIIKENASVKSKRRKFIEITNIVNTAISPYAACKKGCSNCCHINTIIYEHEAIHLANVTGRKMVHLAYRPLKEVFEKGKEFIGKSCPFLVENECSVYEDRPLVCRTHHSLYENSTWCSLEASDDDQFGPMMYDPDILEKPYKKLNVVSRPIEPCGNIGEFFPD